MSDNVSKPVCFDFLGPWNSQALHISSFSSFIGIPEQKLLSSQISLAEERRDVCTKARIAVKQHNSNVTYHNLYKLSKLTDSLGILSFWTLRGLWDKLSYLAE